MEIEFGHNGLNKFIAYSFTKWEKIQIAEALKISVKKLNDKIYRIDNNPKNEGQLTFLERKKELRNEINSLILIIKEFS